jgi:hypothetical protein
MVSLKLKAGSPIEVEKGRVTISGSAVVLVEQNKNLAESVVVAYALIPGDIVRRVGEGEYIVEF